MRTLTTKTDELGATMVEASIVMVCFLSVLLFTFDFANQMYKRYAFLEAVQQAARRTAIEWRLPGTSHVRSDSMNELFSQYFREYTHGMTLPSSNFTHAAPVFLPDNICGLEIETRVELSGATFFPSLFPVRVSQKFRVPAENSPRDCPISEDGEGVVIIE